MTEPHPHVSAAAVQARLQEALAPERLEVIDDSAAHAGHAGAREGSHLTVHIVSSRFVGVPRLARHRLVYDALSTLMPRGIHALAIVASTPEEP